MLSVFRYVFPTNISTIVRVALLLIKVIGYVHGLIATLTCVLRNIFLNTFCVSGAEKMKITMMIFDPAFMEMSAPEEQKAMSFICVPSQGDLVWWFAQNVFTELRKEISKCS